MQSSIHPYIGQMFTFDDGRSIKVIEVKLRDNGEVHWWVTYEVLFAKGAIPKRLSMTEKEFISNFRHLFFPK